jgi:hypothetical protein
MEGQRLIVAVDATHPNDNAEYVNVGGELAFLDNMIFLRGGYKALFLENNQEGLTLGAGLNYVLGVFAFGFDYSYQEFEFLSYTHSFGVSFKF